MISRMLLRWSLPFLLFAVIATLASYAGLDLRLLAAAACGAAVLSAARAVEPRSRKP